MSQIFSKIPGCRVVEEHEHAEASWFGCPIIYEGNKHKLVNYLESKGVQTRNYFAGNVLRHPAYKGLDNPDNYPNSSRVLDDVFFIGTSPVITIPMIDYIQDIVDEYIKNQLS